MAANNYCPSLGRGICDYWAYDSLENVALTRALQMSLSDPATSSPSPSPSLSSSSADSLARTQPRPQPQPRPGPTGPLARPGRAPLPGPTGRIGKRKPRAGKRSATTYITADQENFREMVQRVTGIEPGSGAGPAVRPEPSRVSARTGAPAAARGWSLPTLDTSAFWLDRLREAGSAGPEPAPVQAPAFDFEPLPSFPTLESWGAM